MQPLSSRKREHDISRTSCLERHSLHRKVRVDSVRPVYDDGIILRFLRDFSERRINKFCVFKAATDLGRKSGCSIYRVDKNSDTRHGRRTVRQMYGASILTQSGAEAQVVPHFGAFIIVMVRVWIIGSA